MNPIVFLLLPAVSALLNVNDTTCGPDQFTCKFLKLCIPRLWVCDGDNDCLDHDDERNCTISSCNSKEFQCDEKRCINTRWKCDGDFDCEDKTDEKDCLYLNDPTNLCLTSEFLCNDRMTCIPSKWVCDGDGDCPDGEDERLSRCIIAQCPSDQFMCRNHTCISRSLYCDGVDNCGDMSDEYNCTVPQVAQLTCKDNEFMSLGKCISIGEPQESHANNCLVNNGGCSHNCRQTAAGSFCTCNAGFRLASNQSCQDINECDYPGACSHTCVNEIGSFKCECFEGYSKDPTDDTRCLPTEGHTYLLFTRTHDIRKLSISQHEMTTVVDNTHSSAALDFVFKTGTIFWSDLHENKIYKASVGEDSHSAVISNEITTCDGLAVDWVYDHIYWTDTGKNTIQVANLDGTMKKTLFKDEMDEPRAIVVNPSDGWMYWSDWGAEARIEKGGLDGSRRHTIVSFDIMWPNGLALDLERQRLYWVDAKLNSIFSANYDGSRRTVVLKSAETLHHPYSISVFEDSMYWTDWEKNTIYKANKFNGENIVPLTGEGRIRRVMVVHAYHPYRQPNLTNYCSTVRSPCSHLCLPSPQTDGSSERTTCACPDGLELTRDGLHCSEQEANPHGEAPHSRSTIEASAQKSAFRYEPAISVIVISILLFLVFSSMVAYLVYKNYLRRNVTSINFDNPVYRKTTDDKFSFVQIYPKSTYDIPEDAAVPLSHPQPGGAAEAAER